MRGIGILAVIAASAGAGVALDGGSGAGMALDGGSSGGAAVISPQVPAGVAGVVGYGGFAGYGMADAGGDNSTLSGAGPSISSGPEVRGGPEVGAGPQIVPPDIATADAGLR